MNSGLDLSPLQNEYVSSISRLSVVRNDVSCLSDATRSVLVCGEVAYGLFDNQGTFWGAAEVY
jgi:hypothetical protein